MQQGAIKTPSVLKTTYSSIKSINRERFHKTFNKQYRYMQPSCKLDGLMNN